MQPSIPATSSSGGGGELSRAGLARFQSAPATWLEALLEEEGVEEDEEDPLKQNSSLTQLLVGESVTPVSGGKRNSGSFTSTADLGVFGDGSSRFLRQNSSPAEFFGNSGVGADGYFSNFGIPASYDYVSPNSDGSAASKRAREGDISQPSPKYQPLLKQEQSSQVPGGVSSLIDMEIEKLFEDSVPCKVRAKRGFATHPRSIAERVRRMRISDRIRKLQELVPNMDKQTNTADMLDEAVEYVKLLQRQIQELSEQQKNCKCTGKD